MPDHTAVKICGITDADALRAATEAGADWVGFVFFAASPRALTPDAAARIAAAVAGAPLRVGLFVRPRPQDIADVLAAMRLDALQVYGADDRLQALRDRFGLPVWRPVAVSSRDDLPGATHGADRLLIEGRAPQDATRPGGNGAAFDWRAAAAWIAPAPWFLAGGLTPTNVSTALRLSGARAVDVSSGVEASPGRKDPALIAQFVAAARASAL